MRLESKDVNDICGTWKEFKIGPTFIDVLHGWMVLKGELYQTAQTVYRPTVASSTTPSHPEASGTSTVP